MTSPIIALRFLERLVSPVSDELQQLVASISQAYRVFTDAFNSIFEEQWTDSTFTTANYTTNSAGSITPLNQNPYTFRYRVIGKTMWLKCSLRVTVNNGTTTEIRFRIPGTAALLPVTSISVADTNQQRSAGLWNDLNTTLAGLAGCFINVQNRYVSVQRWDGVAAAGYPTNTVFVGFEVSIPLL